MASNFIDWEDSRVFHASEWIGIGKIYPEDIQYIKDAKKEVLSIPQQFQHDYLPPSELPVAQFVARLLPDISNEKISVKPAAWFSHENPATDPYILLTRPIPNPKFLGTLQNAFGQAWFNGSKSVVDSRFNNGKDRFPLWVITLWLQLSKLSSSQADWKRTYNW